MRGGIYLPPLPHVSILWGLIQHNDKFIFTCYYQCTHIEDWSWRVWGLLNENVLRDNHHIRSTDKVTDANTGMAYSATFHKIRMNKLHPRDAETDYHFQYKSFYNKYVSLINIYRYLKIVSYFITVVFKLCSTEPLLSAEDFQGMRKFILLCNEIHKYNFDILICSISHALIRSKICTRK